MSDRDVLSEALRLLTEIKSKACHTRRFAEPSDGMVTPSSKCLNGIEGDVEEFLNEVALDLPDISKAAGWKMTPEFASDHGIDLRAS
jgi:hypothetical protein